MREIMLSRKKALEEKKLEYKQFVEKAPPGRMYVAGDRKYEKWYVKEPGKKREYIRKKDKDKAKALAKKRYYELKIAEIDIELKAIDSYLETMLRDEAADEMLDMACRYSSFIDIPLEMQDAYAWANAEYETNTAYKENLRFECPSGHIVRSKSEYIIASELYRNGIPFRYENALTIGSTTRFPDFTFYNPKTGETRYWEHWGMIDKASYNVHNAETLTLYVNHGIFPGRNLYITYEADGFPISTDEVQAIIEDLKAWLGLK